MTKTLLSALMLAGFAAAAFAAPLDAPPPYAGDVKPSPQAQDPATKEQAPKIR